MYVSSGLYHINILYCSEVKYIFKYYGNYCDSFLTRELPGNVFVFDSGAGTRANLKK